MKFDFIFFEIKEVKDSKNFKKSGEHVIQFVELKRIARSPNFLNF